ncbi:MAG: GIY-YIG nuclease family protein [Ignavibacteria bacterium]|nr:GIY-YIG nuclease family protein [Ignavibacteria bacterium]
MSSKFFVYVLYSEKFNKTYIGQTNNLNQRLEKHNKGLVISTRSFKPWRVIYFEVLSSRAEAMNREKWLKSGKGREFIKSKLMDIASA